MNRHEQLERSQKRETRLSRMEEAIVVAYGPDYCCADCYTRDPRLLKPNDLDKSPETLRCFNCRAKAVEWSEERLAARIKLLTAKYGPDYHCVYCGETEVRCFEENHIDGKQNTDRTELMCKNCHAIHQDYQLDLPASTLSGKQKTQAQIDAARLRGIAISEAMIAERQNDNRQTIEEIAARLEAEGADHE